MRKRYVEKLSYYKLLDELNQLPDRCSLSPIFISKIDDDKLEYLEMFVTFTKDCENERFELVFMYKSCNVRISTQSKFGLSVSFDFPQMLDYVFNSRILTIADFFRASLNECKDYTDFLKRVKSSDNEHFTLIQSF